MPRKSNWEWNALEMLQEQNFARNTINTQDLPPHHNFQIGCSNRIRFPNLIQKHTNPDHQVCILLRIGATNWLWTRTWSLSTNYWISDLTSEVQCSTLFALHILCSISLFCIFIWFITEDPATPNTQLGQTSIQTLQQNACLTPFLQTYINVDKQYILVTGFTESVNSTDSPYFNSCITIIQD